MSDRPVNRRLSAILAADVAGYTVHMERDTDGTVAAWQAARENVVDPAIAEHSGRIVKHTGDGFLAEFPTVQDAVSCAIAMQEQLAASPLDFRMGINLGDIVDDGVDIHGEGVNVAARIEALASSGGICISGSVHEQVRNRLTYRFEDMGEVAVKNVSEPVRVIRILTGNEAPAPPPRQRRKKSLIAAAAALVMIAAGAGAAWWWTRAPVPETTASAQSPAARGALPSIAVLPFVNMSGDKQQEYFSDGMTEDLITDLSKISGLSVISRTSTAGYKGKNVDIREVGKALNARYVIEGSVRKAGDKVRINAQLTDTTSGGHLWADRYDGDLKDIFSLQDRVLEKIVASLALKLSGTERQHLAARGTDSVAAHDLYLRGLFQESAFTREGNRNAMRLYEQALSIDPDYALAYTRIANILELNARNGWSDNVPADLAKAVSLAEKALQLDPQNPKVYWSLGRAVSRLRTPDALKRAIASLEQAIKLDPNFADAYAFLTVLYVGAGRAEDGLKSVETAMRINPRYPFWYLFMRGVARFALEDYPSAIKNFEAAAKRSPTALFVRFSLAASYAQAGRIDDAEWQVQEMMSMGFDGSINTIVETQPILDPRYNAALRQALRKAGIPEE